MIFQSFPVEVNTELIQALEAETQERIQAQESLTDADAALNELGVNIDG